MPPPANLDGFDFFLLLLVAISTLLALMKGFVRVLFSLLGLVAGLILASWDYPLVATALLRWIPQIASGELADIVAFAAILAATMLIFSLLASLLARLLSGVGLGLLDRLMGAALGMLRGCLMGVAVMTLAAAFVPDSPSIQRSVLAPYFLEGAHAVCFVVPDRFARQVTSGTAHLLQQTPGVFRAHLRKQTND